MKGSIEYKKVNPHLRTFQELAVPRPKKELPENLKTQPFDLEIGAGAGLHAVQYARNNPQISLLAIEKTKNKFDKLQRRHHNHPQLTNLYPIHGNAISWVTHEIQPRQIRRIFLLYPNPDYKRKAQRWAQHDFMRVLLDRLQPGGTLLLATNLLSYFLESQESLRDRWGLNCLEAGKIPPQRPPRSHFEKKYLARGESCWEGLFQKPELDRV